MARFEVVHRHVIIPDYLRPGEVYQFILKEPRQDLFKGRDDNGMWVISVTIDKQTGKLIPLTPDDADRIADWKRRHANTEEWEF